MPANGASAGLASGPPSPDGARSFDELGARLRLLRAWAGVPYRELHRRIIRSRRARGIAELPAYNTVYRCLQPGRRRIDVELLSDVARALLDDEARVVEWRRAHQRITGRASDAALVTVSSTLPDDCGDFIGRRAELDRVLGVLDGAGGATTTATAVIEGMAGVGKTTLAVHAAHRLIAGGHVDDLQLSANLRGYDPSRVPADPVAVLDGFLRQLGLPGTQLHRLPVDRRAAKYRQLLAGRHVLILLDNVATEDQVRPLLPDSPGCLVLITSRRRLAGLRTAHHVRLDAFTPDESLDLLRRRVGADLIDADRDNAIRIADLVGHHPLALAVVASRIGAAGWSLGDHAERLAERRANLRLEDEVEAALGLSYADLPAELQRLLRLLAIHPGRTVDVHAAAALAGIDRATAARQLGSLLAGSLVEQQAAGRYELHDLVRVFAASLARDMDAASERVAALARLLDYYRHSASVAMDLYAPHERDRRPHVRTPGTPVLELTDRAAAVAWLESEHPNLISAAVHGDEHGWPDHASDLSLILSRYLYNAAHHRDAENLHSRASQATNATTRARALTNLGSVCLRQGRCRESIEHFAHALHIFNETGDRLGRARALNNLGNSHERLGNYVEALGHYQQALSIDREVGDRTGEGRALGNLGCVYLRLGRPPEAADHLQQALAILGEVGDRAGEAQSFGNLGSVYERQGRYAEALESNRRFLDIAREVGFRLGESGALHQLGRVLERTGRYEQALDHYQQALDIARKEGVAEVEVQSLNDIGALLRRMSGSPAALGQHINALALAEDQGDRYEQARAHDGIARGRIAEGSIAAARRHWRRALALYSELGTPEVDEIAACLTELSEAAASAQ